MSQTTTEQTGPSGMGFIRPDVLYPLESIQNVTGLGKAAFRIARRNGLVVRRLGKRSFVRGQDFIDYFELNAAVVGPDGSTEDLP